MTPDANENASESPENGAAWLSVAQAAAALNISQKTVRKRIGGGELTARRVAQKRGGIAYLVALDGETERETEVEVETPEVEARWKRSGTEKTPFKRGEVSEVETETPAKWKRDGSEVEVELRDALANERSQTLFLRGVIEGLQQSEAVTKAALREALKLAPKAITSGSETGAASGELQQVTTSTSAPEAPISSDKPRGVVTPGAASNEAQNSDVSSYSALADWLENEILGR